MVNAGTSDIYLARVHTFAQALFVITVHIKSWTSSLSQLSGHKCMERVVLRVISKDLLCHCPLTQAVRACAAAEPAGQEVDTWLVAPSEHVLPTSWATVEETRTLSCM